MQICRPHQTPRSSSLASWPGSHTICPAKKRKLLSAIRPSTISLLAGPSPASSGSQSYPFLISTEALRPRKHAPVTLAGAWTP